ncbi:MAG: hypothetical protein WC867_01300 [Candidatus Pacearchaeota archaeon]|jgi:hypothetical protein
MKLLERITLGLERNLTKEELELAKKSNQAPIAPIFISFQEREPNINGVYVDKDIIRKVNTKYDFTIADSNGLGYYLTRYETREYDKNGKFRKRNISKFDPRKPSDELEEEEK